MQIDFSNETVISDNELNTFYFLGNVLFKIKKAYLWR
jgi:hypothetical protein